MTELERALSRAVDVRGVSVPAGRTAVARKVRRARLARVAAAAVLVLVVAAPLVALSRDRSGHVVATRSQGASGGTGPQAVDARAARARVLIVFLDLDVALEERDAIGAQLRRQEGAVRVDFWDRSASHAEWRELFEEEYPDVVESVGPEQLSESFRVTPRSPQDLAAIANSVRGWPGVKDVVCHGSEPCPS